MATPAGQMEEPEFLGYDPNNEPDYMHTRDPLIETDEERMKKRQERKGLINAEITPFFNQ